MTSPILWVGGEDFDFTPSAAYAGSSTQSFPWRDNTAGRFRSGYARYGIGLVWNSPNGSTSLMPSIVIPNGQFSSSSFWFSCQIWASFPGTNQTFTTWSFYDSGGVERLRFEGQSATGLHLWKKVNSVGTTTTLGSGISFSGAYATSSMNKFDCNIVYNTSGSITLYANGTQIFSYTGDVTTDSQTALNSKVYLSGISNWSSNGGSTVYSEVIFATRDTRNFSVVTQAPTANGNTHNWDGGTAANAAQTVLATAQASPQFSGSAGQIQEYQVTPAIPTGNFSVISVVQKANATIGSSGPTKFDFMVRTGATDYTSSPDTAPTGSWVTYFYNWDTNPNTTAAWLTTDLPASSTSYNMGVKSVT